MAFPQSLSASVPFANSGPWKVGSAYYTVGASSSGDVKVYKSTATDTSWTEQDGTNNPVAATTHDAGAAVIDSSNRIHILAVDQTDDIYYYSRFDTSTDTWAITDRADIDVSGMSAPATLSVGLHYESGRTNELVAIVQGVQDSVMGTAYERVDYYTMDEAGTSWTGPTSVNPSNDEVNYRPHGIVGGTNSGTHMAFTAIISGNAETWYRTLNSSDSLSTTVEDNLTLGSAFSLIVNSAVSFDDGGTQRMVWASLDNNNEVFRTEEDGSDNISISGTYRVNVDNLNNGRCHLAVDSATGDLYAAFSATINDDLYFRKSTDGGATWDASNTLIVVTTVGEDTTGGAAVYLNGADTVLAVNYDGGGSNGLYAEYTIAVGAQDISPTGLASAEAFGTAQLDMNIACTGIASAEAFGSHSIALMIEVTPTGIASAEAFGSHTLTSTADISPNGIASAEAFGTHLLTLFIEPTAIPSAEAFGSHTVASTADISPGSIPSAEAFGTHQLDMNIVCTGIASAEAIPTTHVIASAAAQDISPTGLASAEAFGTLTAATVADFTSKLTTITHTLTNGGAETGDTTGWTNITGGLNTRSASPSAFEGTYYFFGGANAITRAYQDIDLETDVGTQAIDTGECLFDVDWHETDFANADWIGMSVEFLDSGDSLIDIGSTVGMRNNFSPTQAWTPQRFISKIPANARTARLTIEINRDSGSNNDGYIDDIKAKTHIIGPSRVTDVTSSFTNPGLNALTGWTTVTGSPVVSSVDLTPHEGANYVKGNTAADYEITQDYDLITGGFTAADIDNGLIAAGFQVATADLSFDDTCQCNVVFLDTNDNPISEMENHKLVRKVNEQLDWKYQSRLWLVPVNARKFRVKLRAVYENGANNDGYFDDVTAYVMELALDAGSIASIPSAEAFGTTSIALSISPTSIPSAEAFGSHQVDMNIACTGIASAEAFGSHTFEFPAQDVSPTGIASAEAFGSHTVNSIVDVTPASIPSAEAFGTAQLDMNIVCTGIVSAEAFGSHTVAGGFTIIPTGIASAEAFGSHTVTAGAVDISPGSIGSAEAFGSVVVSSLNDIAPGGIASGEAFGSHTVTAGAVDISPTGISSGEAIGSHSIIVSTQDLQPTGISSAEAFGAASLAMSISVTGIASEEAFGTHIIETFNAIGIEQVWTLSPTLEGRVKNTWVIHSTITK